MESNTMPDRLEYVHKKDTKLNIGISQPNRRRVKVRDITTNTQDIFDSSFQFIR